MHTLATSELFTTFYSTEYLTPVHNPRAHEPSQGEDVVAGIRTPEPIETLERSLPGAFKVRACHVWRVGLAAVGRPSQVHVLAYVARSSMGLASRSGVRLLWALKPRSFPPPRSSPHLPIPPAHVS